MVSFKPGGLIICILFGEIYNAEVRVNNETGKREGSQGNIFIKVWSRELISYNSLKYPSLGSK